MHVTAACPGHSGLGVLCPQTFGVPSLSDSPYLTRWPTPRIRTDTPPWSLGVLAFLMPLLMPPFPLYEFALVLQGVGQCGEARVFPSEGMQQPRPRALAACRDELLIERLGPKWVLGSVSVRSGDLHVCGARMYMSAAPGFTCLRRWELHVCVGSELFVCGQ